MQLVDIQAHIKSLGYPDDPNTAVSVERINGAKALLGAYAGLTDKQYVASFQANGILFMGKNLLNQFNNKDKFVPLSEIGLVKFEKTHFINGKMLMNAMRLTIGNQSGESESYIAYTYFVGQKYWKQNIANAEKIIAAWPPVAERSQSAPTSEAPAQSSLTDQLHELQSLLDESILTQAEFDAKKKQLLEI